MLGLLTQVLGDPAPEDTAGSSQGMTSSMEDSTQCFLDTHHHDRPPLGRMVWYLIRSLVLGGTANILGWFPAAHV